MYKLFGLYIWIRAVRWRYNHDDDDDDDDDDSDEGDNGNCYRPFDIFNITTETNGPIFTTPPPPRACAGHKRPHTTPCWHTLGSFRRSILHIEDSEGSASMWKRGSLAQGPRFRVSVTAPVSSGRVYDLWLSSVGEPGKVCSMASEYVLSNHLCGYGIINQNICEEGEEGA